jgi:hypothetical protein
MSSLGASSYNVLLGSRLPLFVGWYANLVAPRPRWCSTKVADPPQVRKPPDGRTKPIRLPVINEIHIFHAPVTASRDDVVDVLRKECRINITGKFVHPIYCDDQKVRRPQIRCWRAQLTTRFDMEKAFRINSHRMVCSRDVSAFVVWG